MFRPRVPRRSGARARLWRNGAVYKTEGELNVMCSCICMCVQCVVCMVYIYRTQKENETTVCGAFIYYIQNTNTLIKALYRPVLCK